MPLVTPYQGDTPPEPEAPEAVDPAKLQLATEFASQLSRSLKQIAMYRHNTSKYGEYLQKPFEALTQYTAQYGALVLSVDPESFRFAKEPVFEAKGTEG